MLTTDLWVAQCRPRRSSRTERLDLCWAPVWADAVCSWYTTSAQTAESPRAMKFCHEDNSNRHQSHRFRAACMNIDFTKSSKTEIQISDPVIFIRMQNVSIKFLSYSHNFPTLRLSKLSSNRQTRPKLYYTPLRGWSKIDAHNALACQISTQSSNTRMIC